MAQYVYLYDKSTGQPVISNVTLDSMGSGIVAVEDFDVTDSGGQLAFQLATNINDTQMIDVYVNGVMKREGAYDFTRDAVNNRIIMVSSILQYAWVHVVIHVG